MSYTLHEHFTIFTVCQEKTPRVCTIWPFHSKTSNSYFLVFLFHYPIHIINTNLQLAHVDNGTNAVASLHDLKGRVDLAQRLAVRDELVDLEAALEVVADEAGQLGAALDATKRAALPHTARHQLEGTGADLLAGRRDTNNDALAPALVRRLESGTHNLHVARAVKGVVAATVGQLNQLVDDSGALGQLGGVDKVGGTKLAGPFLLGGVDVDDNNLAGVLGNGTLDDGQTDTAGTENGDTAALLNLGGDAGGTVTGGDTTAQKAGAVKGSVLLDGDDGDVGNNGVLGEGGGAHKVQDILAAGLEARSAVGHHALALGGTDLAAQVGLAGLAELALLALGGAAHL